ncbi:aldehyde dehydrogenase [Desulfatiferula olefinivorans]
MHGTIPQTIDRLRRCFDEGRTQSLDQRTRRLTTLKNAIVRHEPDIMAALKADLNKSGPEAFMTEINVVIHEIEHTLKHLKRWMRPRRVRTPLSLQPARSYIHHDPLGVALIIGPWNYPFNLTFCPLVGALAAGNTALVKPSELAPRTSALTRELIERYFSDGSVAVIEGGADATTEILTHRFDTIFFTGGEAVGRIVMTAAARHLTPVTLELGGKTPCVVDSTVDLPLAARRIAWGKFMNAGQTCVAPDYLLVQRAVKDGLVKELQSAVRRFFGDDPRQSPFYGRIVHEKHLNRLKGLRASGTIISGGDCDEAVKYLAPTLMDGVLPDAPIMQEEIFGPILPIIPYEALDEAIACIRERPKPLALYVFSKDSRVIERVIAETSSGGVCVNDTLMQISSTELPFGGVGPSGMGSYHGKASFDTFTHRKSVLKRATFVDPWFRYAPFKPYLRAILRAVS